MRQLGTSGRGDFFFVLFCGWFMAQGVRGGLRVRPSCRGTRWLFIPRGQTVAPAFLGSGAGRSLVDGGTSSCGNGVRRKLLSMPALERGPRSSPRAKSTSKSCSGALTGSTPVPSIDTSLGGAVLVFAWDARFVTESTAPGTTDAGVGRRTGF